MTVSESDRERVIALLREQAGEGRLDMDEFGQRLDEAYQATTVQQLQHALRELPVPAVAPPPRQAAQAQQAQQAQQAPRQRPSRPRPTSPRDLAAAQWSSPAARRARAAAAEAAWKGHLYTYIWVNLLLVAIWGLTGADYFWPIWPMVGWGFGLAAHGSAHRAGVRVRRARERRELNEG